MRTEDCAECPNRRKRQRKDFGGGLHKGWLQNVYCLHIGEWNVVRIENEECVGVVMILRWKCVHHEKNKMFLIFEFDNLCNNNNKFL